MPKFLKTLTTVALQVTGGSPASGRVLTSDSVGVGTWTLVADTNVDSAANIAVTKLNADELALVTKLNAEVFG